MAKQLTDLSIQELSLVIGSYKGKEWAPRNEEALVLAVKGGEKKPTFLNRLITKLKAGFPVSVDVPDNIDNDDDGADDYNQICGMLTQAFGDMQAACGISDDDARAAAICAVIDGFKEDFMACCNGEDAEKAGARHNADDRESLALLKDAHAKMGDALRSLGFGEDELNAGHEGDDPEDDDANPGVDEEKAEAVVTVFPDSENPIEIPVGEKAKDEHPKPYGDVKYADPENGKYPVDTEEHARAAWSYINMPKNAKEYSADKLAEVKDRIRAACKHFGIDISDKAGELDMTQEELDAKIAEAAAKAAEAATAAVIAKMQPQLEAAQAAQAESAKKADELQRAAVDAARKPSASSGKHEAGVRTVKARPVLVAMIKEQLGLNPEPTRF